MRFCDLVYFPQNCRKLDILVKNDNCCLGVSPRTVDEQLVYGLDRNFFATPKFELGYRRTFPCIANLNEVGPVEGRDSSVLRLPFDFLGNVV